MNVVYNYSNNAPPNRNLTFDCCGSNARSYLVFGQVFVNQKSTTFDTDYKFLGCEYDRETGYIRTGDRPYDPVLGIFPTCDKLAHLRPWCTPYNYCQGDPINRQDKSGLLDDWDRPEDKAMADQMDKSAQDRIASNQAKISELKTSGGSNRDIRDLKAQNRELANSRIYE